MAYAVAQRRGGGGLGRGLLLVGLLFLVAPFLAGSLMGLLWPLLIAAPGLFLFALVRRLGRSASILTIPATFISTLGLLLLYQNLTGHWASWAYAWTLLIPTSIGIGTAVYGELARKPGAERFGEGTAKAGVGMFVVGMLFFEILLNVSGWMSGLFPVVMALLLIVGGVTLMRRRSRRRGPAMIYSRPRATLGDRQVREMERELFGEEEPLRVRR